MFLAEYVYIYIHKYKYAYYEYIYNMHVNQYDGINILYKCKLKKEMLKK